MDDTRGNARRLRSSTDLLKTCIGERQRNIRMAVAFHLGAEKLATNDEMNALCGDKLNRVYRGTLVWLERAKLTIF